MSWERYLPNFPLSRPLARIRSPRGSFGCAIDSWGGRRPSLGGDVAVMGAAAAATAAGGRAPAISTSAAR